MLTQAARGKLVEAQDWCEGEATGSLAPLPVLAIFGGHLCNIVNV
jgi:hypothetical protein